MQGDIVTVDYELSSWKHDGDDIGKARAILSIGTIKPEIQFRGLLSIIQRETILIFSVQNGLPNYFVKRDWLAAWIIVLV